jgi:PAS domain S-box-containing protein
LIVFLPNYLTTLCDRSGFEATPRMPLPKPNLVPYPAAPLTVRARAGLWTLAVALLLGVGLHFAWSEHSRLAPGQPYETAGVRFRRMATQRHQVAFEAGLGALWLLGLLGLTVVSRRDLALQRANRLALDSLRASEERYRLISENAGDVIWLMDAATHRFTFVSPSVLRVTGYTLEEVLALTLEDVLTPASSEEASARLTTRVRTLRAGEDTRRSEVHLLDQVCKDGTVLPMEVRTTLLLDEGGTLVNVLGVSHDVTERKAAHEALRASEELFSRAFSLSPDAININRLEDGVYLAVNQGFTRLTGYTEEEVLGRSSLDPAIELWVEPEDRRRLVERLLVQGEVAGLEALFKTRDGRHITGLMSARAMDLNGVPCILSISRDISERKRAEEFRLHMEAQLAHAQKMESLGTLASGVAHDMNNVLMAIMGIGEALREARAGDDRVTHAMDVIQRAGERGRDLVRGLTQFARKEIQEPSAMDLNNLVREETALLRRTLLQKVTLVEQLEPALPLLLGDVSALGSVLMNLCVNAVDAMPDGGTLTIRTRALPGARVELSVEDTGCGMSAEVQAKAVEPFYTTKPKGKGTGLGLSMAYSTAKAHGGSLAIRSAPGRGTAVVLQLPALGEPQAPAAAGPEGADTRPLRILVVDDEELIREALPPMLELLGHAVALASSGQEALDRLARGPAPDLVLLDLNMPEMSGSETLRQLRTLYPDLPVLIGTGYLDEVTESGLRTDPHAAFVRKPFTLDEIRQGIERTGC